MGASSAEVTGGRPVRLLTVRMFMVTDFVTGDVKLWQRVWKSSTFVCYAIRASCNVVG